MEATYAASMREKYKQSLANSIRGGQPKSQENPPRVSILRSIGGNIGREDQHRGPVRVELERNLCTSRYVF